MRQWFLVTYDVRDDRRLRRLARILEGFGTRVQYSVFRCHLSDRGLERLRWEMSRCLQPEDGLLVLPLCERCVARIRKRHGEEQWPEEPETWEILG